MLSVGHRVYHTRLSQTHTVITTVAAQHLQTLHTRWGCALGRVVIGLSAVLWISIPASSSMVAPQIMNERMTSNQDSSSCVVFVQCACSTGTAEEIICAANSCAQGKSVSFILVSLLNVIRVSLLVSVYSSTFPFDFHFTISCLQCFDAVSWATERASGHEKDK